jgi:hypothetical protein
MTGNLFMYCTKEGAFPTENTLQLHYKNQMLNAV